MATKLIARISSDLANVRTSVSLPTGTIIAPPQPCRMRQATSSRMSLDIPHRNEPSVNSPIAEAKTRRVPKRAAIQPLMGIKTARARVYPASPDFMLSGVPLRAAEMVGTAVFRIVVSSDSMKNATATSHGNSRLLAWVDPGGGDGVPRVSKGVEDMAKMGVLECAPASTQPP